MDDREYREDHDHDHAECIEAIEEFYQQWERRVRTEGIAVGFQEGLERGFQQGVEMVATIGAEQGFRGALVRIYHARFGALPPSLWESIEDMEDVSTLSGWVTLFATATAGEIAAALLTDRPEPQSR